MLIRKIPSLALLEAGPGDSVWDVGLNLYGICPGLDPPEHAAIHRTAEIHLPGPFHI